MATPQVQRDNFIRIGDIVTLKYLKHQSFLSAEGILIEDVCVSTSLKSFEDHQFQIYVQRQYSATNELEEFLDRFDKDHTKDFTEADQGTRNHLEALLKGKENESTLNRTVMKNKTGNIISFGDTIQLLHVKSGKFITVRPNDLARDERENMKVTLSSDGSVMSWLKVLPRFKINREGEQITNNAEIQLRVLERSNEFLHCAERAPPRGKRSEVNSSLESPTPWKISIFQRTAELKEKSLLLTGQLVYIRDPESQCALAPLAKPLVIQTPKKRGVSIGVNHGSEMPQFQSAWSSAKMRMVGEDSTNSFAGSFDDNCPSTGGGDTESDNGSVASIDEFIEENGEVVFKPFQESVEDSDAIWVMESRTIVKGGTMRFRTDKVHFRHFNTGKYLSLKHKDEVTHDVLLPCLEETPSEKGTLFQINQLHSNDDNLINGRAVQLKHTYFGMYFERGDYHDSQRVYSCLTTRVKAKSVSIILNRYEQVERKAYSQGARISNQPEQILDIHFGFCVMHHITRFVRTAHFPTHTQEIPSLWPKLDVADRSLFSAIILKATFFVRGYSISAFNDLSQLTRQRPDKSVIQQRQDMFRSQGLLQAMVSMLSTLAPMAEWASHGDSRSALVSNQPKQAVIDACKESLGQCLNMLYDMIKNNLQNQLYIADHLLVILAHVSTDKTAANVARELLSSNRELQETRIGHKEITIFATEMKKVPMNSMYLQLLQTCCSCLGQGLPKNQDIVYSVVFDHNRSDILIDFRTSNEHPKIASFVDWGQGTTPYDLYVAPYFGKNFVRGEKLCSEGPVPISLTWNTKTRYAPGKIYSRDLVPLWEVYRTYVANLTSGKREGNNRRESNTVTQAADAKRAVCDFFIAQLQVSAEMCLGRNYHVITQLEKVYTYESLVTIIKAQSGSFSNDVLKRSAAYLLQTLYVDRDPQSSVKLPRLTRTLSEVSRSRGVDLVRVEGNQFYQFALLQCVISKHLAEIRSRPFQSHTHNLMKVLQKLVEFNFYGEMEKLRDTIELLVACLKRDDTDLDVSQDQSHIITSMMKMSIHFSGGGSAKRLLGSAGSSKRNMMSTRSMVSDAHLNSPNVTGSQAAISTKGSNRELFPEGSANNVNNEGERSVGGDTVTTALNESALSALESASGTLLMRVFVVATFAVSVYFEATNFDKTIAAYFDYAVFAVLAAELVARWFFTHSVRKTSLPFLSDFFNMIDIVSIILYLVIHIGLGVHLASFVKFARIFNVQLLLKQEIVRRYLGLDSGSAGSGVADAYVWAEPERYHSTPESTVATLVKIAQVLCSIQSNIEDQNLSLLLKGYTAWASDPKSDADSAYGVIVDVVKNSTDLLISSPTNDDIYIDLLMYASPQLVQVTLELLMIHHSSHRILIDNLQKLQLISTDAGEEQYSRMEKLVSVLKRDADTHEIWGNLDSHANRQVNTNVHKFLAELTENCRKLREVLKFDESHEPVTATQNILRNLGCFDLCMKVIQLISSIDKDNPFAECHVNTRNLALASSRLLYWFVLDNPANQALAYTQLNFFIKNVDAKIETDKVIGAIFRNNITLMECVPKKCISEFIDMICNVGRFPQYLALMSSIICVGEKNVIENQYEVIKLMSSPENIKKVVQYFVPVSHPAYAKKVAFMTPFLQVKDVAMDALPSDLAYHLELMGLLSSCTVGTSGMTTIEAKVQSMFNFVDVIDAMLDPNSILLAKIRLGLFLYNAMLDVETLLPAVKDADCIWKLLIATQDVFSFAKDELRLIEKNGWDYHGSNRQKIEYVIVCLNIVHGYFSAYYDYTIFKPEVGQIAIGVERITIKEGPANEIIKSLYFKIASIYEMVSPLLAQEHHKLLHHTLVVLNNAAKEKIVAEVADIHTGLMKAAEDYSIGSSDNTAMKSYDEFRRTLLNHEKVTLLAEEQVQAFIKKLEDLPWKDENVTSSVRFEPLIERLVTHICGSIQIVIHGDEAVKFIEPSTTKTDIWVLRILRTMVENRWGMTIYERDDDGGEEQDDAVIELMKVYNDSGVTNMCLDLIAKGVDIALQSEALKLLVAMLFKEGGALSIQKTIYAHLSKAGSEMFFKNVRTILQNLMSWHKWNGVIILEEGEDPQLPDEIILVRCLQLMCEGHYQPNQNIFREQPNNPISINLLDDFVLYLQALDNIKCRTSTAAEIAVSATILEVIQGPCEGNQDYFALNTELIETLNRKIRQHPVNDCDETQEIELKKASIDIFQALLEGQARKTAVYERMLSVIHIDVILVLCRGEDDAGGNAVAGKEEEEESDESVELRTESLVLMQMLTDFRPSLKKELGIDQDLVKMVGGSVACIEVVWRGELQRRFFHVPDICKLLAKSTKDSFVANVNRVSAEDKLYGLLEASKEMYREILHQQVLTDYKIDKVFSRTNQDRATWLTFYIVLIINILFTLFYHSKLVPCVDANDDAAITDVPQFPDDDTYVAPVGLDHPGTITCSEVSISQPEVNLTIEVLNYVLIFLSLFVLALYLVVRVPVNYQTFMENGYGMVNAAFYTALDPITVYYFLYLVIAVIGLQYHVALTFLLLDFVTKSPTTQSVLRAVYNPRKQIFMTLVLAAIVVYIFAMYMFFFFNDGEDFADESNTMTLGNVFKFLVAKGLPQGTATDYMITSISIRRIILDLGFFISILLILNILKGITIDTFVELRKDLEERLADTKEKCFICGIEKNTFNRTLDRDAFDVHTKVDQNLWSYVYFIIYIWQQDKDDDDGLESFVRHCIEDNDLFWFPMRKAIRLAEHQEKGDVHSMKFRFRKDLTGTEGSVNSKMASFKDQLSRTISRVEKSLEYEAENEAKKSRSASRAATGRRSAAISRQSSSGPPASPSNRASSPTADLRPGRLLNAVSFDQSSISSSISGISVPSLSAEQAAQQATNRLLNIPMSSESTKEKKFTSVLDADKLGQVHIKVISIVGLNIQQSQVEYISVRIISELEQNTCYPEPKMERVKAFKSMLKNIATEKGANKDRFRTSFVSVKALFKEQENETGNLPEPTLLKFNVLENPKHLVHQGRLPTVDLSKYNVKVQILYGAKGETMKFLGGVHVPFVELLNKAHTGEPLEVPFTQRQVEKSLVSATTGSAAAGDAKAGDDAVVKFDEKPEQQLMEQNSFCFITLSAIASSDLLQEWAMLMTAHR